MLRRTSVLFQAAACAMVLLGACAAPVGGRREAVGDVAAEWGIRGEGSQVSDPFAMPAGETSFGIVHEGAGPFSATLIDEAGNETALLADGEGVIGATRTVTVPTGGQYRVRVEATGPWELIATYPESGVGEIWPYFRVAAVR